MVKTATLLLACIALVPLARGASFAPDGVDVTYGQGHNVAIYGAALYWNSLCQCVDMKERGFETRLVTQLAYWRAQERPTPHRSLWDASATPMLRWVAPRDAAVQFFVDAGIGIHLLSATRINNDRVLSTALQFGETAGAGIRFGERRRFELGVYVQHVSNARLKQPNNGLTYQAVVLRMALP